MNKVFKIFERFFLVRCVFEKMCICVIFFLNITDIKLKTVKRELGCHPKTKVKVVLHQV